MAGPTLGELLRKAGPVAQSHVANTHLDRVVLKPGQKRFIFATHSTEPYSDPDGHLASLFYPNLIAFDRLKLYPGLTPMNRRVRLFCSCPAWSYWGPSYLSTRDKYRLPEPKYSEPRPADERDPDGENYLCKHLLCIASELEDLTFSRLLAQSSPQTPDHARVAVASLTPAVESFLEREGKDRPAIQAFVDSLTPDNAEDELSRIGMLCEAD